MRWTAERIKEGGSSMLDLSLISALALIFDLWPTWSFVIFAGGFGLFLFFVAAALSVTADYKEGIKQ